MIKVYDFKEVNKKALVGFFNLYLPDYDLTLRDCKLMQTKGNYWISFPAREYEKDGEKKFFPYIKFGNSMMEGVRKETLDQLGFEGNPPGLEHNAPPDLPVPSPDWMIP